MAVPPPVVVPGYPLPEAPEFYGFDLVHLGRGGGEVEWRAPAGVDEVGVVLRSFGWERQPFFPEPSAYERSDLLLPSVGVTPGVEYLFRLGGAPPLLDESAGDSGGGPGDERAIVGPADGGYNGGGPGYYHTAMDPPVTLAGGEVSYALTSAGFGATEVRDPDGHVLGKVGGGGGMGASRNLSNADDRWEEPSAAVGSVMPSPGSAPRAPRSGVIFPAIPPYLSDAVVDVPGYPGGTTQGGGSRYLHETDWLFPFPEYDLVSGAGGGGYGAGASSPVARRDDSSLGPNTSPVTKSGRWGANYARAPLAALMVDAIPGWAEAPTDGGGLAFVYWPADPPGGFHMRRVGWGMAW